MTAQPSKGIRNEELVKFLVRGCHHYSLSEDQFTSEVGWYALKQGYCRFDTRSIRTGYAWFSLTKAGHHYLEEMESVVTPSVGEVKGYFFVTYPGTENEQRLESQNWEDTERWYEIQRTDRRLWVPGATSMGTYLRADEVVVDAFFWQWPSFIGKRYYRNKCYDCGQYRWDDSAKRHGLFFCYTCKKKEDQELDM